MRAKKFSLGANHTENAGLFSVALTALPSLSLAPGATWAQDDAYPSRPVTLVVGFSAGGSSDLLGRKLAQYLGSALGQPVVVQNKEGAGSTIAVKSVADARPDGYTLLLGGSSGVVIAPILGKVGYDPVADLRTVAMIGRASSAIAVNPSVPARSLPELVALAKANPGKYEFASAGINGFDHLTGEFFKQVCGDLEVMHIPYRGGSVAMQGVIAGHTSILITTLAPMYPHLKTGQLRIIAVSGRTRSASAPELPTAAEQGFPELVVETANFLSISSKTPAPIVAKLRTAMQSVMSNPAFIADLKALHFEPANDSAGATEGFVKSETEKWRKIAVRAKLV